MSEPRPEPRGYGSPPGAGRLRRWMLPFVLAVVAVAPGGVHLT
ncbi:hypothetical protein ACIBBD_16350 [Streptomyces sp. NPDC051315]